MLFGNGLRDHPRGQSGQVSLPMVSDWGRWYNANIFIGNETALATGCASDARSNNQPNLSNVRQTTNDYRAVSIVRLGTVELVTRP